MILYVQSPYYDHYLAFQVIHHSLCWVLNYFSVSSFQFAFIESIFRSFLSNPSHSSFVFAIRFPFWHYSFIHHLFILLYWDLPHIEWCSCHPLRSRYLPLKLTGSDMYTKQLYIYGNYPRIRESLRCTWV